MADHNARAASVIAQLLGDVIMHHNPVTSEQTARIRTQVTNEWLEGLETHIADIFGPLADAMMRGGTMPEPLVKILTDVVDPAHPFSGVTNSILIYGVGFALASSLIQPFTQAVNNQLWSTFPDRPLSPADAATAVVRNITFGDSGGVTIPAWAEQAAAQSGIDAQTFETMVGITGMPPDATSMFEMFRRGIIDEARLTEGLHQSDLRDSWIPQMLKMQYTPPTWLDMVRAAIQAQLPYAEANDLALKLGLEPPDWIANNPAWVTITIDISARPPGPVEMAHAANRGLTTWTGTGPESLSFQQAIAESDVKTKYTPLLQKLAQYFPPNGEIRTLLLHGGITEQQALDLWRANGVPDELAKGYLFLAQHEQITQDKALAKGDIETLVMEQAIDDDQALELLGDVGYSGRNAQFIIEMAHFRYELRALENAVRRISTLYIQHKVSPTETADAFAALGVPAAQITGLLEKLTAERDAAAAVPTPSQVATALYYKIIDQQTATQMLERLGYSAWDAWLVLSVRLHGSLPDMPEPKSILLGN